MNTRTIDEIGLGKTDIGSDLSLLRQPVFLGSVLALTSVLFGIAFTRLQWTPRLWCVVPLLLALALIALLDFRTKIIPDLVTLPGLGYALALAAFAGSSAVMESVLGAITGGGIVLVVAVISRGAVGGGDIKLMAMLGACLGWKDALAVLALSQLAAALIAAGLLVIGNARRRETLPIGTILALIGTLALVGAR